MVRRTRHPGSGHGRPIKEGEKLDYKHYIYYCKVAGSGGLRVFKANRKGSGRTDRGAIHKSKTRVYQHKQRDEMESGW
jgi:hypothetical protein